MARSDRIRYQLFLPKALSERFEALAARPGVTRSSILAGALAALLDRRGESELNDHFAQRLDHMSNQLGRIERDGHVQIESLALFVRYMLMVNAPLAQEDETSRAIGRDRFAAFVLRVGQRLASGRRSFDQDEER
jgi:predicted DNA-binding protein